ncbi:MAG: MFS transporter [Proteobacteria bacterium]|nr:MFS transporter [Pseudomonadota bacterium]
MSRFHRTPALALSFATFLTQLDVTAVVVAMPSIGADLGFGIAGFAWVMDAYSLAFTGLLLASGALADRYGRRRALLLGNVGFALASLACAFAWDGPSLWLARALQGAAAAFVITGSISLIAGLYADAGHRARAFAVTGIVSGVAMALGPTLGGAVASAFGWRWIFLANLPFCLLAGWMLPRLVAETRPDAGRPLDPTGILLLTLALSLAVEALLQGSSTTLTRPTTLLGSTVIGLLFVLQQRRRAQPILDPALLARPAMIASATLLVTLSVGYWSVLVYLPLFLQADFGFSVDMSGLVLLAATLPMLVLPPVGGRLVSHWGSRRPFTLALLIVAAGDLVLAGAATHVSSAIAFGLALTGMACIGIGAALAHSQLSGAVVALASPAQAGMASALTIVMRQGGFAVGIAALGATVESDRALAGFAQTFALAACVAAIGAIVAWSLLPKPVPQPAA